MGFSFKKMKKSFNQNYNPFSSDFDTKKALINIGTLGAAGGYEMIAEATGEGLSEAGKEIGRGYENFKKDVEAGMRLSGATGDSPFSSDTPSLTEAEAQGLAEVRDPRKRKGKGTGKEQGFGTLTDSGQMDSQPSLIG